MSLLRRATLAVPLAGLLLAARLAAADAAPAGGVLTPASRQSSVDAARQLLTPKPPRPAAGIIDPFHPPAFAEAVAALSGTRAPGASEGGPEIRRAGPRTDRDVIQAIAAGLTPTGRVALGGVPTLLFREKKVKVGDKLIITFENTVYEIQVTAIGSNNFTLRLNREEFTRPIKQGTAP